MAYYFYAESTDGKIKYIGQSGSSNFEGFQMNNQVIKLRGISESEYNAYKAQGVKVLERRS